MSQQELLIKVIRTLESVGIQYMVTGSTVSSLQGAPRSTHDVDLVVAFKKNAIPILLETFQQPHYYLDEAAILDAMAHEESFNLMEISSGDKVDFWMLTENPFDQSRFARRYVQRIGGAEVMVSRPEDTILKKLTWAQQYESEKQYGDALRVYELQAATMDMAYLDQWAKKLDIGKLLSKLRAEAKSF